MQQLRVDAHLSHSPPWKGAERFSFPSAGGAITQSQELRLAHGIIHSNNPCGEWQILYALIWA